MNIEQRKNPKHWKPERGLEAVERERGREGESERGTRLYFNSTIAKASMNCLVMWARLMRVY